MAPTPDTGGDALTAKYVGPDGLQLFDGTILHPGDLVAGIGADEAAHSALWEVPTKTEAKADSVADAGSVRDDWSFGTEEGGGGTGRPELASDAPAKAEPAPTPGADS